MADPGGVGRLAPPASPAARPVRDSGPESVGSQEGATEARRASIVAAVSAGVLIGAQVLVLLGETEVAELAQIGAFIVLAATYLAWAREPHRQVLLAMALLPLIQLMSLALPTRLLPTLQWFVTIGVPTYALLVLAAYRLGLRPGELGLRRTRWQPQARIVLVGAVLAIPGYLILRPQPLVADPTPLNVLTAVVIVAVFGGFLEEGLFRGLIQSTAERSMGRRSIGVSAFATGLLYSTSLDLRYLIFAVLVGILFGTVVRRTGSIVGVSGAHAALLAGQLVLLPALFR